MMRLRQAGPFFATPFWRLVPHKHRWLFLGKDPEYGNLFKCQRCGMVSCSIIGFVWYD